MTTISKCMTINSPVNEVFTYFARPEHMADQFPENMGLNVIPIEVKNGFGVGTIFRISGDFDGKRLEWDCETIDYIPHRKIVAQMIKGPLKNGRSQLNLKESLRKLRRQGLVSIMVCQWDRWEDLLIRSR